MDSEELDSWYEAKKDMLTEKYEMKFQKGNHERLSKEFAGELDSLHKEYEKRSMKITSHDLRRHNLIFKIKIFMMKHFSFLESLKKKKE
ncbi:MAG: hypothetical protein ABIJ34_04535 [archaeon]